MPTVLRQLNKRHIRQFNERKKLFRNRGENRSGRGKTFPFLAHTRQLRIQEQCYKTLWGWFSASGKKKGRRRVGLHAIKKSWEKISTLFATQFGIHQQSKQLLTKAFFFCYFQRKNCPSLTNTAAGFSVSHKLGSSINSPPWWNWWILCSVFFWYDDDARSPPPNFVSDKFVDGRLEVFSGLINPSSDRRERQVCTLFPFFENDIRMGMSPPRAIWILNLCVGGSLGPILEKAGGKKGHSLSLTAISPRFESNS